MASNVPFWFLCFLGCAGADDDSGGDDGGGDGGASDEVWQATLDALETWMAEREVPGLAIAIVEDGEITRAQGLGVKALSTGEPVTADTLFKSSSTATKTLVAAAVLDAVEDGRVDLDTSIEAWLPGLDMDAAHAGQTDLVTLLTMRAGADAAEFRSLCTGEDTLAGYLEEHPPLWAAPPGAMWIYSAAPAILAAAVLEEVEGRPWTETLTQRILSPIGADTALFDPAQAVAMDHAVGHVGGSYEQDLDEAASVGCPEFQASGGLLASARDHARLMQAFLGDGPLEVASLDQLNGDLTDPGFGEPWGYGLQTYSLAYKGEQVVHQYGTNHGYTGGMSWVPARGFGVVLLLNRDADLELTYSLEEQRWAILDRFLGLEGAPPDASTDPSTWTIFDGTWLDPELPSVSLVIETEAGVTTARFEPASPKPMSLVQGGLDAPYEGGGVFHFEDANHWFLSAFHLSQGDGEDHVLVYTDVSLGDQYYFVGRRQE